MNSWVSLDRVVKALVKAKNRNRGAVLLIGAGCSVTAGIPDAAGFVNLIKTAHPEIYSNAKDKSFHGLLQQLSAEELDSIISSRIESSKINWAHIACALLMQNGYVDWIVTGNFDFLVERACGLLGEHPAVYDCANSRPLAKTLPAKQAIFHLNGQHPSRPDVPRKEAEEAFEKWLDLLIDGTVSERPWIVVGFGGENDPVFDRLQSTSQFKQGLYWALHKDPIPPKHVLEGLLFKQNGAFHTDGPDADSFLLTLAQSLEIFPPAFLSTPFEHLDRRLSEITDFPIPGQNASIDLTGIVRKQIRQATDRVKSGKEIQTALLDAQRFLLSGECDRVLEYRKLYKKTQSPELAELLYWASIIQGCELTEKIKTDPEQKTEALLEKAEKFFQEANDLCPEKIEALYNWGIILTEMARENEGGNGLKFYSRAGGKFQRAIKIDKSHFNAYYAWGETLRERALLTKGEETFPLLSQAIEKFQAALAEEPNHLLALCACGKTLAYLARHQNTNRTPDILKQAEEILNSALTLNPRHPQALTALGQVLTQKGERGLGEDAEALWLQAQEKFQSAVKAQPDHYEAYCSWGTLLWNWAPKVDAAKMESLYKQAAEKFQTALSLYHRLPDAYAGWGNVLFSLGLRKSGEEASYLFGQSLDKFRSALTIDPDNSDVLNSWGKALLRLANFMEGTEADAVYTQAEEKFQAALAIRPNHHEALHNWGTVLLHLARIRKGQEKILLTEAIEKYRAALAIEPNNVEVLNNWGDILFQVARAKTGKDAEKLFQQAEEKYQAALSRNPSYPRSFFNLGWVLMEKAKSKKENEREELLVKAAEHFASAVSLKPNMAKALLHWGTTLLELSKLKKGINAHPLLANAKKKFLAAEEFIPGSCAYNLARLMALLGNESGCREWLEKCTELEALPSNEILLGEADFTLVQNSKWFRLLASPENTGDNEKKL